MNSLPPAAISALASSPIVRWDAVFSRVSSRGSRIFRKTTTAGSLRAFKGKTSSAPATAARSFGIEEIAAEKGCKPSQLALAWVLAQDKNIVPIPGTKRRKYVEENVAAIDVKLSVEDLRRIDEIFPTGAAAGLRYPEHMMKIVNG